MKTFLRWLCVVVLVVAPAGWAESVSSLPAPTGFVNDFAGVLRPDVKQNLETLLRQVDRQANAQIAVVTIKTLDNDQSIEEFATELEDKWKVGNKDDRGVLMIFVMNPRRGRIEVGYGLEGILNDAKVGDIGRSMSPYARQNDYNTAIPLGARQIASVIAQDAGVNLTVPSGQYQYQYHRTPAQQPITLTFTQVLIGGGVILLIIILLASTGNIGLLFFLLGNLMGGGGRGGYYGGRRDGGGFGGFGGGDGGGFGGFGGGSSGGGGASGDW